MQGLLTLTRGGASAGGSLAELGPASFRVETALTGVPGAIYVITYNTHSGQHRFAAKCLSASDEGLLFAYPRAIDTLVGSPKAAGRQTLRLQTTVRGEWRLAKGGKGEGRFIRGTVGDISRSGASLICDVELRPGTEVELRLAFSALAQPLELLADVVRASKPAETSHKTLHGLHFRGLTVDDDRTIMEYINRRQAERRARGLV
ncbi:MAG: PilZ domain-containing protein [Candidatus Eremiobacteraeota bacterium]|nr:PilZ domain-containing protein [Candidatus Eremiobacteraeota bacterium]